MKTRRAMLVEPGRLEIQDAEINIGGQDVLVKMEGCGLCTWELNHWAGRLGECPQALGHEAWGVVAEVGKEVKVVKEGDRVTGLGGQAFSDYFVIPQPNVMPIRADLDQECVPGEPLYCVQNVIRAAHPEVGDNVVVVGCGPMGLWAIQGLAHPALGSLIAVDIDDKKLALAESYGATHTLNPRNGDVVKEVEEITAGHLADVAVEGTGGPAGVQTAIDLLHKKRPKLVIMSSFKKPIEVDLVQLCSKAVFVSHAHPGISVDPADGCRRTATLINNGIYKIDDLISHRFSLDDIMSAFRMLEKRDEGYMKGIVVP